MGYSTYQLAEASGVSNSTVVRIELGQFTAPHPDKLIRFAIALGLSPGDVYAKAGYTAPEDLPEFNTYLEKKYPALTEEDRRNLEQSLCLGLEKSAEIDRIDALQGGGHAIAR
jgi:transcriptional regulator with XRE-family HTH domain